MGVFKAVFSSKQFQGIALAQLFMVFGSSLLNPVLPVHLKLQGLSESQIGLIMGVSAVGALIFRPWAGRSVDRQGSRRVVIWGQLLTFTSIAMFIWAASFWPLMAARMLQGIAFAFYGTAAVTFASSTSPGEYAESAIAFYSVCTMIGMGVASSTGPLLFQTLQFTPLVYIGISSLAMAILIFGTRTQNVAVPSRGERAGFFTVMAMPEVFAPAVCLFASNIAFSAGFTYVPLYALNTGQGDYSLFFLAFTVAVVSVRISISYINRLWSSEKTALIASCFNIISLTILVLQASSLAFVLTGWLIGLGFGIIFPSMAGYVVTHISANNRGTALSIVTAAGDVGFALGASLMGVVADLLGYSALFAAAALVVSGCTVYYYYALLRPAVK